MLTEQGKSYIVYQVDCLLLLVNDRENSHSIAHSRAHVCVSKLGANVADLIVCLLDTVQLDEVTTQVQNCRDACQKQLGIAVAIRVQPATSVTQTN